MHVNLYGFFFFLYVNKKKLQNIIVMKQIIKTVHGRGLNPFQNL